ncbi:toll/interleukin-1 receptor domain-containing protein [Micromonospora sp. WMMA1949]|uniref:toll/interleukin-1 receptor domain-containing protein n=1 Tax=Micromonospora sp. WMMA1949 TaxID=3015162 RepID=UPI0022B62338|nr:toll/interleukin-1 receptor domain-containing protein [Micromonospora sp. WMMA1949]MCZ7424142.1 toll/interleukin-1 receptor domain-containing protein [Micromonospora sp. WMMA1949]
MVTAESDVFLCYSWADKRRADELYDALVAAGLTVFQDESGMRDYDHISERIDAALRATRVLVVLYTPSLPSSEYCRQEIHFALLRSYRLHRSRARVLAVVQGMDVADVRPGRLKHWRLPRTDSDPRMIAKQIAEFVAGLRAEDPRRLGDAPEPPPAPWRTGQRRDPHELYGREFELWSIHDALFPEDDPAAGGQVAAVTGPGGEGKTMLAEQYARLFADDFPGGVFAAGGAAPAPSLPYLWLVDNVPEGINLPAFEALLAPTREGRTLVTAQHDLQGWVHPSKHIRIGGLGRAAGLATLTCRWPPGSGEGVARRLQRLSEDRREYGAARHVVDALGGHALALRLAAGLAGASGFAGFRELAAAVDDPGRDALALAEQLRPRLSTNHIASVAATMALAVRGLPEAGRDVLLLTSVLAPEPVPAALVADILADADGLSPAEARQRAAAGLAQAAARYLAEMLPGGAALVHPLVFRTVRTLHRDDPRRQRLRLAAVARLGAWLDAGRERHSPSDELAVLLPHVSAVAAHMHDVDEWHLLNEAGRVHAELGHSRAALCVYQRLYEVCRTGLGEDDRVTLAVRLGLGTAYGIQGDHRRALRLLGDVHVVLTERLGAEDTDTLTALNNIAVVHTSAGEHERARDLYQRVHATRERRYGPGHPDTLDALYNLAIATGRCGDTQEALRLKTQVYEAVRSMHGDAHERTLDALGSLAVTTLELPDRDGARRMFRQVYEQRRTAPAARAATADAAANLAAVEDDPARALRLLTEAYQIRVAAQGPAHPRSLRSLRSLLIEHLRGLGEAPPDAEPIGTVEQAPALPDGVRPEQVRLDADDMDERVELFDFASTYYDRQVKRSGEDSTDSALAICYLAHATAALDQMDLQFDQAWPLIDNAAEGLEDDLGPGHPASVAADEVRQWIATLGGDAA